MSGSTSWTDRVIRNTGVVVPHIAKNDIFTYNIQFPHSKKLAEAIADFHLHIVPISLPVAGNIIAIDHSWQFVKFGDVIGVTLTGGSNTATFKLVAADQYKHKYFEVIADMAVGAETYSSFLLVKCQRRNDGQDTYAGEFALLGGDCHYLVDRLGSQFETND